MTGSVARPASSRPSPESTSSTTDSDGLIWYSTPTATVGLVVRGGVVIDAPPYARKWAIGRMAEELLNHSHADTAWLSAARSTVNDTVAPDTENVDWNDVEQDASGAAYPELPANPHNHRFTISLDGRGPMIVVRAGTAQEANEAFTELENAGTTTLLAAVYSHMKAEMALASGAGPVSPVPAPQAPPTAAQQVAQAYPTPPPVPQPSHPGQPYPGQPAWQQAGAPAAPAPQQWGGNGGGQAAGNRGPKPRPADWPVCYKINVPFQAKDQFKSFREENKDYFRGKVAWAGGGDYWVHGDVVQSMAGYNPVAA